jgi:hypothetical protein
MLHSFRVPWHRGASNYRNLVEIPHRFAIACFVVPRNPRRFTALPITSDKTNDNKVRSVSSLMRAISW